VRRALAGALALLISAVAAVSVATAQAPRTQHLGTSVQGRPIGLTRIGEPDAPRKVLVVGCIHGDECAGRAIVARLLAANTAPPGAELLLVRNLNPDGFQRATRQNARGVDLNRNSSQGWRRLGALGTPEYPGPRPFSEPESRAIRALILRERPAVTVWYHQPLALVDFPEAGAERLTRAYARATGLRARRLSARPGSLSRWQNARVRAGSSIVVELGPGRLRATARDRHAFAVLVLAST